MVDRCRAFMTLPWVELRPFQVRTSQLAFGCASLLREPSPRQRRLLIATAIDAGINHFDVARMYGLGAAEGVLGSALASRRHEVTIATKFGISPPRGSRVFAPFQAPM